MKKTLFIIPAVCLLLLAQTGGNIQWTQIAASSRHGNGTKGQTSDGTGTSGHCAQFDSGGNVTDSGGVCGTGSGNLTGTPTNHGVAIGGTSTTVNFSTAGTAHQVFASGGASADGAYQDHTDVWMVPFANCIAGAAGSGANTASTNFTAACRAGSNNLGGMYQAAPNVGASLQIQLHIPGDWDTSAQPYINIYYGSGTNTTNTVIWTVSSACVDESTPGASSDDPSFQAETAFASQTMAATNKMWNITGQFTKMTSGNGCKVLSPVIFKLALSGTATANINAYYAIITFPRLVTVQAN